MERKRKWKQIEHKVEKAGEKERGEGNGKGEINRRRNFLERNRIEGERKQNMRKNGSKYYWKKKWKQNGQRAKGNQIEWR